MLKRTSTTAPTAAAAWRRSAPSAPVWALAALSGLALSFGLAACGSSSPKAHDTPLAAPALVPPKDSSDVGTTATGSTTDTISTTTIDTTGAGSTGGGQAAGTATPPVTPVTPAGPTGGAAPAGTPTTTTPAATKGDKTGGAGTGAFCKENLGACGPSG